MEVKNMAYWKKKCGMPTSPNKMAAALVNALPAIGKAKDAADKITGKKDLHDAMKKPIKDS